MEHDRRRGVCLTRHAYALGEERSLRLKAWAVVTEGPLRWEVGQVLREVLLYTTDTPGTNTHNRIRDFRAKWQSLLRRVDVDIGASLFLSAQSRIVCRREIDEDVDCASSMTTTLLLIACADSILERKPKHLRNAVRILTQTFFEAVLPSDAAEEAMVECVSWRPALASRCGVLQDHKGACAHVRKLIDDAKTDCKAPLQHRFVARFVDVYVASEVCGSAQDMLRCMVSRVVVAIDGHCQVWGEWDLTKVDWLGRGDNKGRKDPHLKRFLAEEAQRAKRGKTLQNAVAGAGLDWGSQMAKTLQRQSLCAFKAACDATFQQPLALCVATDGFRLGKPAKELTVTIVADLASGATAVLPPQDSMGCDAQ